MPRAVRWTAALAACAGLGAALELVDWLQRVGGWRVAAGSFAVGLLVGVRAIWGVVAAVVGVTVVAVAQIDPRAYTDFDQPDVAVLLGGVTAVLLGAAAAVGAFVRWIVARATSRRASD